MNNLDPIIEAQLAGLTVRYADLMRFSFKSGEMRLFQGLGKLVDGNGEQWLGIGRLGGVSGQQGGPGGAAEELTLTLSGDERINRYFSEDNEATAGQTAVRYMQFFDVRQTDELGNWVEWQPLGPPLEIFSGTMSPLVSDRAVINDPTGTATATRIITVKVINLFFNRRKPPHGFFTHRDQLARTNNTDNIFQEVSRMVNATVRWPAQLA